MAGPVGSGKDQPLFTLKQVTLVCQRLMKEREEHLKETYDKVLSTKLSGMGSSCPVVCGVWLRKLRFIDSV